MNGSTIDVEAILRGDVGLTAKVEMWVMKLIEEMERRVPDQDELECFLCAEVSRSRQKMRWLWKGRPLVELLIRIENRRLKADIKCSRDAILGAPPPDLSSDPALPAGG